MYELTCQWCGKVFLAEKKLNKGKPRRFCNRSCSACWRMSRPEYVKTLGTEKRRKAARKNMLLLRKNKAAMKKLDAYLHSPRNPFRDPAVRMKGLLVNAAKGWPHLTGGNGKGPTLPQKILHEALGIGWDIEVPVEGLKADIGNRKLKLAIEVDGHSHKTKTVQAKDRRKEKIFEANGWRTIRFWNLEILDDLPAVLKRVKSYLI